MSLFESVKQAFVPKKTLNQKYFQYLVPALKNLDQSTSLQLLKDLTDPPATLTKEMFPKIIDSRPETEGVYKEVELKDGTIKKVLIGTKPTGKFIKFKPSSWNISYFMVQKMNGKVFVPDFDWYIDSVIDMLEKDYKLEGIRRMFENYISEESYDRYRTDQSQIYAECLDGVDIQKLRQLMMAEVERCDKILSEQGSSESLQMSYNRCLTQLKAEQCKKDLPPPPNQHSLWMKGHFIALFIEALSYHSEQMSKVSKGIETSKPVFKGFSSLIKLPYRFTIDPIANEDDNQVVFWPRQPEGTIGLRKLAPSHNPDTQKLYESMNNDALSEFVPSPDIEYTHVLSTGSSPTIALSHNTELASPVSGSSATLSPSPFTRSLTQESALKTWMKQGGGCGCMSQYGGAYLHRPMVRRRSIRRRKTSVRKRKSSVRKRKSSVRRHR